MKKTMCYKSESGKLYENKQECIKENLLSIINGYVTNAIEGFVKSDITRSEMISEEITIAILEKSTEIIGYLQDYDLVDDVIAEEYTSLVACKKIDTQANQS